MATFDQLSAEQRAIIELVLKQGKTYEELGTMLGMPGPRVRDLAEGALVKLSPVSAAAVDDEWRAQVADYLLNQQTGPEGTATKGHLRRSESARGWSRSVLDSLEQFYDENNLPTIPEGEPAAAPRRERKPKREKAPKKPARAAGADDGDDDEKPSRKPSIAAAAEIQRRRFIFGGGAAALVILFVVLIWPVGVLLGGDDDKSDTPQTTNASAQTRVLGQLVLRPVGNASSKNAGIAVIVERGGKRQLIVQAQLSPLKQKQAYEVWMYNSNSDAESIGAQVPDAKGAFQGAGPLPANFSKYKYIDVSLEPIDKNAKHSDTSVLRGALADLQAPSQGQEQGGSTAPQSTTPAPQATTPGQ